MAEGTLVTEDAAIFREALPDGGALIGLDLGTKTIGVALCDAEWRFATAGKTLAKGKFSADKAALWEICKARSVRGIVIGLPLNMDGSAGPRVQASRAFAKNIAALELPVLLWDERWSTMAAERAMIAMDTSRAVRAQRIDSHAAAIILQGAIDRLAGGLF